jgi:hypothetical protein
MAIAAPVFAWIGNAVVTTLTSIGVSTAAATFAAAVVTTVSQAALLAGLQYVVDDVSRQKSAPQGQELQLRIDPDMPREMLIGERIVAGSMVARYSRGSNLYNAHFVYQLADHPCVELSRVYGDGRVVQSTPLTHGTRTEITAYSYSGGARVWMTWHDGRPGQTVDSDLVTKSAQDPDVVAGAIQGWTNDHLGRGCAYVHVEVQWDSDILTSIPSFLFHVKGAKLYDRRLDTTAGGSGSHRIDDPSTWAYSTNAAVALDHYLLGYQVEDDPLAFGIGLSPNEVPYDIFAAAADLCDEDVTTGTGGDVEVIKRYAVNGIISAGDFFEDVLTTFQNQMAARVVDLGGRIGILGAEERTPVVSLDDDDWVSDEAVRFADKLPFSDLYGAVTGSFPDPGNLYQPTPYEKQVTDYLLLPDGGEATTAQLDLPFEVHPRRAVRLASAWLARESLQPRLIGTFATRSLAWKLEPGDWFTMTSTRLQITASEFEVIDVVKHDDFTVTVTARAIDPDFLAFSVDDDPDLSVPPDVDPYDLLLEEPAGTITAITITGGGATEPAIRFTLTAIDGVAREVVIEVQEWNGSALTGDPIITTMHSDESTKVVRSGIMPDKQYKARVKARIGARESPWTAWSSAITTSTTYTVPGSSLASAIVGQGWGATATEAQASNALIPVGTNLMFDTSFRILTGYWSSTVSAGSAVLSVGAAQNIRYRGVALTGSPAAGTELILAGEAAVDVPCVAGNRFAISALAGAQSLSSVEIRVLWRNAAGTNFADTLVETVGSPTLAGDAGVASYHALDGFATAPANAVKALFYVRGFCSGGASPYLRVARPLLAFVPTNQTEVPAWSPGFDGEAGGNVTETRTAAAIAGQGWGATASESAASNAQVPAYGANLIRQTRIPSGTTGWEITANDTGLTASFSRQTESDGEPYLYLPVTGTPAAGKVLYIGSNATTNPIPVIAGERYEFSADVYHMHASGASGQLIGFWLNSAGSSISQVDFSSSTTGGQWNRLGGFGTAPTNARAFKIVARIITGAGMTNPFVAMKRPMAARARSDQTVLSAYFPGAEADQGADVTSSNTAAGISGQGNQATSNSYYQSSDPGGSNGDWWYDTTNSILKYKASGSWQNVANFKTSITASVSPSSVNEVHTGSSFSSGTITITPAGGTSYSYAVTFVKSGGAANVTLSATNAASFTATASLSSGQDVAGGIIVDVFDTSGASCSIRIPLNFTRTD